MKFSSFEILCLGKTVANDFSYLSWTDLAEPLSRPSSLRYSRDLLPSQCQPQLAYLSKNGEEQIARQTDRARLAWAGANDLSRRADLFEGENTYNPPGINYK